MRNGGSIIAMPGALSVALPLVLGAVLIASAIAKWRSPDDLAGWKDLGVPRMLRREWIRHLHPWGELALGAALAVLGGWLGLAAALVAVALMIAYTVVVARVAARSDDTSCSCFGARKRVTVVTVIRNVWLTVVAVGAAAVVWSTPLVGGALAAGIPQLPWLFVLAVAAATTALILWPDGASGDTGSVPVPTEGLVGQSPAGEDDLEYVRTRTPAVPVTLADGSVENLRTLAAAKPILLLSVSPYCGSCEPVYQQRTVWRELLPEVDVRLLLQQSPESSPWTERGEPQSLHDVDDYVRGSIGEWATPTAVLLGADGLLAGGPITGDIAVARFVDDIYESLHGVRPDRADSPA